MAATNNSASANSLALAAASSSTLAASASAGIAFSAACRPQRASAGASARPYLKRKSSSHDGEEEEHCTPTVVFSFFSRSADGAKPGQGAGEASDGTRFSELAAIRNWRQTLSNFHITDAPFQCFGHSWWSVEHAFHAQKFRAHPEFYRLFTAESESDICRSAVAAKTAGGKSGKVGGKPYRPKHVAMDPRFYDGLHDEAMHAAQEARFRQDERSRAVLLATGKATLMHSRRGDSPVFFRFLCELRTRLRHEDLTSASADASDV